MKIRDLGDSVEISGYVNAVERNSRPLWSDLGQFVERISKGAFNRALSRNDDVKILLNHDPTRKLGSEKQGNLELSEDNIGLKAKATITDPEVVKKARAGLLRGWSFGFSDRDVEVTAEHDMPVRIVHDLDLAEVSILDDTKTPAYDGTLIEARTDSNNKMIFRVGEPMAGGTPNESKLKDIKPQAEEKKVIDYSKYKAIIDEMKRKY
jgi:HK97 family phage prohead protease